MKRKDVLTWQEAQAVWRDSRDEIKRAVELEIRAMIAAGRASPCCLCNFRKTLKRYDEEIWPERLKKLFLRQDKGKRKGKVFTRHP